MRNDDTPCDVKERIDVALNAMRALNSADVPSPEAQAADYISKLDGRFAEMKSSLQNNVRSGIGSYPSTMLEAYTLANSWKSARNFHGNNLSVYQTQVTNSSNPTGKAGRGNGSSSRSQSHDGRRSSGGGKNGGTSHKSPTPIEATVVSNIKQQPTIAVIPTDKGRCYICDEPGHYTNNCPYKDEVRAAIKEEKEDLKALTLLTNPSDQKTIHITLTRLVHNMTCCGGTSSKILLDNQAQASIFSEPRLLEDIRRKAKPVNYSGLTDDKIEVIAQGDFLGMPVDFTTKAKINIISFSQAQDICGMDSVGYDPDRNLFYMVPPDGSEELHFVKENGLFVCNFVFDTPQRAYPTTVEDNRRNYTKTELRSMDTARNIQKKLGFPASTGMLIQSMNFGKKWIVIILIL